MNLQIQMENTGAVTRKLTITVAPETVDQWLNQGFLKMQKKAKVKGFREGQVPLPMVKQVYGKDVRHQVLHDLIEDSYREALKKEGLKTVGAPAIDTGNAHKTGEGAHDHEVEEGKAFVFTATVEVLPEIKVKNYTGISLKRPKIEVGEKDVDQVVEFLLDNQAQLVPVGSGLVGADGTQMARPAQKGDFAEIQFSGHLVTEGGLVEAKELQGNRVVELGSGSLIPGFEDELVGMRCGTEKVFRLKYPKDFPQKEFSEKDVEFKVKLQELKEKKLPELTDEFAKELGYEDIVDMRKKAQEYLVRERTDNADRKIRNDLVLHLIEKTPFEVPANLLHAQTRALAQDLAQNLKEQGANDQQIAETVQAEIENIKKRAENQVRASLILDSIGAQEKIEVDPGDVDDEIKQIALSMKAEEEKLREFYKSNPGRYDDLVYRMREEKVLQFLLNSAKIKAE